MALFSTKENRIKCGRCNTEFDFSKNVDKCPLCGFGRHLFSEIIIPAIQNTSVSFESRKSDYLTIPPQFSLPAGKIVVNNTTRIVGSWGMVNDFFSGKALLRINANMIKENNKEYVSLYDLIENAKKIMASHKLTKLKGFPNDVTAESSVGRLVYHFVDGFHKMGLFEVKPLKKFEGDKIWNEDWKNILIRPTIAGLSFARLPNKVFDENNYEDQTLTVSESEWIINYLREIDKEGFKEYTLLKEIVYFIKKGNNGNKDLWEWFKGRDSFVSYVKSWSDKKDDSKAFEKQLHNLAQTFSSGKISLLRELGIIKNKRNDYTIIGEIL
ncbi:hypothetical protein FJZ21_03375 [Candidatus Pacearchaeota archaeon]|nr:hypothetical protein [Candidatus Pacearchaeota archaeon]